MHTPPLPPDAAPADLVVLRDHARRATLAHAVPTLTLRVTAAPSSGPPPWWTRGESLADRVAWPVAAGFTLELRATWPLDRTVAVTP